MVLKSKDLWLLYLKLFLTVFVWGMSFVATKYLIPHIAPISVVFSRVLIGLMVLGILLRKRNVSLRVSKSVIPWFLFFGVIAIYMHLWVQAYALYSSKASTATWIVATTPIFIAILSRFLLKENLSYLKILGIAISFFGVLVVVSEGDISLVLKQGISTVGDIIILVTSFNWAFFSVISRLFLHRHREIPQLVSIFYTVLFGFILIGITFILKGYFNDLIIVLRDFKLLVAVLFLGLLSTGLAYAFWYDALDALEASKVGVFMNIQPVVGMVAASIVLGEEMSFSLIFGGILILIGVYFVNKTNRALK
ncbi:MAG: DMT family transporter [Synergistetes bacterium]|nr:DMT family transporter [Synergistota bacterium]MDW8192149.1 DMT family transporter [Synergistota bacterium]